MSVVRIVDRHGNAIVVDVPGAPTTSEAAAMLAGFMRQDVYFTGETHPHNESVRTLLREEKQAAQHALEDAQRALWAFERRHPTA